MFSYFSPIRADRSHSGGHWQDRSLVRTPLLLSRLQMEQSHFTWLILASCSDASVLMVLWCQRRASGLDKNPPLLNSSIICEPESCVAVSRMVSRLSCPLTSQVSSAAETVKTHRNVHYMCLFRWIFFFIYHHQRVVCAQVCLHVCVFNL